MLNNQIPGGTARSYLSIPLGPHLCNIAFVTPQSFQKAHASRIARSKCERNSGTRQSPSSQSGREKSALHAKRGESSQ